MRKYAWIFVLIGIILAVWAIRYFTGYHMDTEVAYEVEYEYKVSSKGLIVRDESVISSGATGTYEPSVSTGSRVISGQLVGVVYPDGIDEAVKQQLGVINSQIADLENNSEFKNFEGKSGESIVKQTAKELSAFSRNGNFSDVDIVKSELSAGVSYRDADAKSPKSAALSELHEKKKEAESKITSGNNGVFAPLAGLYFDTYDNNEAVLTKENVTNMSVSDFEKLDISDNLYSCEEAKSGEPLCRVAYNGRWYFATVVSEEDVKNSKAGDGVLLQMTDFSDEKLEASIYSISAPEDGKCILTVCCRSTVDGVFEKRNAEAVVILKSYKGLKLTPSALRVNENGQAGVYVNSAGIVRFRKVNILYRDDDNVIVESSQQPGYIQVYDTVIKNAVDIEEGQFLE